MTQLCAVQHLRGCRSFVLPLVRHGVLITTIVMCCLQESRRRKCGSHVALQPPWHCVEAAAVNRTQGDLRSVWVRGRPRRGAPTGAVVTLSS